MARGKKKVRKTTQDLCLCTVNEWGQDFLTWLTVEKALDADYAQNLSYYANGLLLRTDCVKPTQSDVPRLQTYIIQSDWSKSYKRHVLRSLELYLEFLGIRDPRGNLYSFRKPRGSRKLPSYLTQDEMRKLVRATRNLRESALITLYCTTGLRLREALGLNIRDVDFEGKVLHVKHAKFDKEREVPMSDDLITVLKLYLEAYHRNPRPTDPLFLSQRGGRWSANAAADTIARCGERAGIDRKVTPHMLRHSFATAMVGNGCDIFHLSKMMGHNKISTTEIYLHVNSEAMREQYDSAVPNLF